LQSDEFVAVLWTRRPVCGPRSTVIDRLSALRSEGALDDFEVQTWPEEVALSESSRDEQVLDVVDTLEQWAAAHDLSLRPPFERRTASLLVGGSETVLTTPMMLLAVYEGGDLRGVYPCTDGDQTWTIMSYLDAVETTETPPHRDGTGPTPAE
jgi:hypothetical protein